MQVGGAWNATASATQLKTKSKCLPTYGSCTVWGVREKTAIRACIHPVQTWQKSTNPKTNATQWRLLSSLCGSALAVAENSINLIPARFSMWSSWQIHAQWQLRGLKCRSQPMQKDAILLKYSVNFFESKLTTLSPGKLMSAMTIGLYLPVFFEILLSKMACSQRIYCLNSYYIYSKSAIKSHHVTGMRPFWLATTLPLLSSTKVKGNWFLGICATLKLDL